MPVDEHAAVLSSGTWSLLGLELPEPVLTDAARDANLTNERGIEGTTRLLKNVMGLWLLEESRRAWDDTSYEELHRLAEEAEPDVPLFDPDDDEFLRPGDMPARIAAACERSGQAAPDGVGATVRSILVSLACKYRWTLERLEAVSGRDIRRIHVIGGGARNDAAVPPDRRPVRPRGARRPGRGDRARQRARAGARRRRARARSPSCARPPPRRPSPSVHEPSAPTARPTNASWPSPASDRGESIVTDVEARLRELVIETPSWGYGDSGTRFGTFPQPGRPRDVFERIDDAAEVHRLTGTAGAVALHFPWDEVDDYGALREHIEARGLKVGAVNPNLFQDDDYKLGSVTHPDARGAREGGRRISSSASGSPPTLGSTAQSLWLADGTNYPGQDDLRARRAAAARLALGRSTRSCPTTRSCSSSTSSSSRRSTPPTSPTGAPRC